METKDLRLEVNLEVVRGIDQLQLLERIRWALNLYGVVQVQGVAVIEPPKR